MASSKQTVVISGVTSGMGRALVDVFIASGHIVIGCGRTEKKIAELQEKFGSSAGDFCVVNVANDDEVKVWADKSVSRFGAPTFLLNCASIVNARKMLWETTAAEFDQLIDINLKGTVNTIRHFVPHMVKARRGTIVNFSSGWGRTVAAEMAPYVASKFAIEGLSKSLASELPPPMACVPLDPGMTNTPMLHKAFGTSANRMPSAEEWAVVGGPFILSLDRAANGKSLTVSL